MRILVIGKTGFIATSLARILLREGHSVVMGGRPELDFLDDHSVDEFLARGDVRQLQQIMRSTFSLLYKCST